MPSNRSDETVTSSNLYEVLGVEPDATVTNIKRAYRRLALRYHPDRNPNSSTNSEYFLRVQHAYDTLSDERMRRIYDRYGELGLKMAGQVGGELLDPLVSNMLSGLAFGSAILSLLLILFFALLAHRVDGKVDWPYAVVFTPLWVIDSVLVLTLIWTAVVKTAVDNEEEEEPEDSSTDSDSEPNDPATPLLNRNRRNRHRRILRKFFQRKVAVLAKVAPLLYIGLLVFFQVSLVLRLDGHVDWSVWRIAAPWLVIEGIHACLLTLEFLSALLSGAAYEHSQIAYIGVMAAVALDMYWWILIRVSQAILICLKLTHAVEWSWIVVFVPSMLPLIRGVVLLWLLRWQLRAMGDQDIMNNQTSIITTLAAVFVLVSSFVYSFVALLIWKLTAPLQIRLALVLIPVFVGLSLMCCCCSCLSCCLSHGIHVPPSSMDQEESNAGGYQRRIDHTTSSGHHQSD